MTAAIGSELWVVNNGSSPVNLNDLTVRYYLTNEVSATLQKSINWAQTGPLMGAAMNFPTGDIAVTVNPIAVPKPEADTYLEFGFSGNQMLAGSSFVHFSWTVQDFMSQSFTQTNDYSYNASASSQMDWQNVVLFYQGQSVVWGTPP
jgi:hypothetical protein